MADIADRTELRVAPPPGAVLDLAVWDAPPSPLVRLSPSALAPPPLSLRRGNRIELLDLSAKGVRLGIAANGPADRREGDRLLVYLRLIDLDPESDDEETVVFALAVVRERVERDGAVELGLWLTKIGRVMGDDPFIEFISVEKYGVGELGRWCAVVARPKRDPLFKPTPTVNLGRLLDLVESNNRPRKSVDGGM